jgi:hypothetical protein
MRSAWAVGEAFANKNHSYRPSERAHHKGYEQRRISFANLHENSRAIFLGEPATFGDTNA